MEVDWIYLAEVSVQWRDFLNRVIKNFFILYISELSCFLCDCQHKRKTFSVHHFACLNLRRVSVRRYTALACRTLQVAQSRCDSAVKKPSLISLPGYRTRFYHARQRPIIQRGRVVFIYISKTYYVSNILNPHFNNLPKITLRSTLHGNQQFIETEQSSMYKA